MATMNSSLHCHDQIPPCSQPLSLKKYHGRFRPSSSSVAANRRMGRSRNLTISATQGEAQNKAELSNSRTSTTVIPPTPFPPPQPQFGSPILWIGVGVGISIVFSWAAKKVQSYAMQQALKAMMEQSGQGGNPFMAGQGTNPFGGQGRTPFMAGPGSNPFGGQGVNPFAGMPPTSFPVTPPPPPPSPAASSTVNVTHSTVSPPQSEAKLVDEKPVEKPMSTKRVAFTDVEVNTLVEDKVIAQDQPSPQDSPPKPSFTDAEVVDNNTSFSGSSSYASQDTTTQNGKTKSFISVEMLETMLDDPKIQQMVFPYLPEEMRDPVTFKRMIQLPQVRQQLQEALNNMGGDDGLDMLKYMNSDAVKQQFEQIGLTPEEVVGKILASPDIAASLQNPKVVEAIMDCSQNPLNITKYQNDQEVMNALLKIAELFPGATSSPY